MSPACGFVLGALVAVSACGAIRNGPEQRIRISTVPPGARFTVDGKRFSSPKWVTLRRDQNYTVRAELSGFEPAEKEIESRTDRAVVLGNCLLFLCIPQIWEAGAASQYRLEPHDVDLMLNPIGWSPR